MGSATLMYNAIWCFTQVIEAGLVAYFFISTLALKTSMRKVAFILFAVNLAAFAMIQMPIPGSRLIATGIFVAGNLTCLSRLSKDGWGYKLIVFAIYAIFAYFADVIGTCALSRFYKINLFALTETPELFLMSAYLLNAHAIAFCLMIVAFIQKCRFGRMLSLNTKLFFLGYPFFQLHSVLAAYIFGTKYQRFDLLAANFVMVTATILISDVILYFVVRELFQKAAWEKEYQHLQQQQEREYVHLKSMMRSDDQLRKVVHDLNNNLATTGVLMEGDHWEEAERMLEQMHGSITETMTGVT